MRNVLFLALATVALTACGNNPPPPADTAATTPAATAPATTPAPAPAAAPAAVTTHLWLEPAGLRVCDKTPQSLTVFWDARGLPSKGAVSLSVLGAGGKEKTFLTAGRVGKKDTGAWMVPGSTIVLRAKDTNAELARARVKPIACE